MPDLRIIDDMRWNAVQGQIEQRLRYNTNVPLARQNGKTHLLSASSAADRATPSRARTITAAGQKERGTCSNTALVGKGALETATLSIFQHRVLAGDHARLFADGFRRESCGSPARPTPIQRLAG